MKTIFVVHCITGPDSAWLDRDVAEVRAKKMDMRVAAVPMPDYGDVLPSREPPAWNGCPPGYRGGPSAPVGGGGGGSNDAGNVVPVGSGGGGAYPSGAAVATGGNGIGTYVVHPQQWSEKWPV